jgi:hypothetical protein
VAYLVHQLLHLYFKVTMEMIIDALHDEGGTGTWRNLFWDGAVRKYATLEIASIEVSKPVSISTKALGAGSALAGV